MLDREQVATFHREGYLVVPDALVEEDLAPVRREYEEVLDRAATDLYERGDINSTYSDLSFAERYTRLVVDCPGVFYYLGISLPLDYETLDPHLVRAHFGPALFGLLSNPKILDIVESIIGPEIALNPVQQTRMKPPQRLLSGPVAEYSNIGATTWHQDFGAVMDEAADTDLLTVWVAMTDATEEMGCLAVIPGSHREEALSMHCPGRLVPGENYIPQPILDRHGVEPTTLPVKAGTVILLTRWTEHGALSNRSQRLRWSFDLRYQPVGQPTGRPAFPSFVLRSVSEPTATAELYAASWEETRQRLVARSFDRPIYEQARWLSNRDSPLCA